jgi:prolyl oligopeptidase
MRLPGFKVPLLATLLAALPSAVWAQGDGGYSYPQAKRGEVVESLHGVPVADPYRWLENPDDPEVRAWIEAENKLSFGYLEKIPERPWIRRRLAALWNYERFGVPFKSGGRYFWSRNDGLQNQSVLYWAPSLKAQPKVLLDPNKLSKDGTAALSGLAVSEDGKLLAYSISQGGSDWQEWRVRNVDTGKDLPDKVEWSKFSDASWTKDGKGFFYSRYDAPKAGKQLQDVNYYMKLYYHRLGTPQSQDELIYERKDQKEWGFDGHVTDDGRYLILSVWKGTERENRVFFKDLQRKTSKVVELLPRADASYTFIGNRGPVFWFQTNKGAPLSKVISMDARKPDPKSWRTIVPEAKSNLESCSMVGGKLIASYLKDAHSQIKVFSPEGKFEREVKLPTLGTASGFGGRVTDNETFYGFSGFTYPTTIYRYDIASGTSEAFRKPKVAFDPSLYETKQVFYSSRDGTRVPMFLTHRKGLKLDGQNPTLLVGYGGFNISLTPWFSVANAVWLEMGGVYAVANLRGGGEYGTPWHDGGRLKNKQNVFDDFIAAAEWLIANKYTSTPKLAINGGSNGGLLVGACLNQRPDLFGAALPDVGVMDMLRFHKFTIGWAWVSDYGSPDRKEDFDVLRKYSPYHNIEPGVNYPPTLITTGDHDDRVVPAHSFKYAARLQAAQAGPAPILIRIETQAGHGAGKPTSKIIEEVADQYAFLVRSLRFKLPARFFAEMN